MQIKIAEAQDRLSEALAAAEKGEGLTPAAEQKPVFRIGLADGAAGLAPDFLEPMPADEIELWAEGCSSGYSHLSLESVPVRKS